jgi:hypothetical protein
LSGSPWATWRSPIRFSMRNFDTHQSDDELA